MKKSIVILCALLSCSQAFSQYQFNRLTTPSYFKNITYSGMTNLMNVNFYRNSQYLDQANQLEGNGVIAETNFWAAQMTNIYGTITLNYEKQGLSQLDFGNVMDINSLGGSAVFHIGLFKKQREWRKMQRRNKPFFSMGVGLRRSWISTDLSRLIFSDQLHPYFGPIGASSIPDQSSQLNRAYGFIPFGISYTLTKPSIDSFKATRLFSAGLQVYDMSESRLSGFGLKIPQSNSLGLDLLYGLNFNGKAISSMLIHLNSAINQQRNRMDLTLNYYGRIQALLLDGGLLIPLQLQNPYRPGDALNSNFKQLKLGFGLVLDEYQVRKITNPEKTAPINKAIPKAPVIIRFDFQTPLSGLGMNNGTYLVAFSIPINSDLSRSKKSSAKDIFFVREGFGNLQY